ncbi:antitoxin component YwqK of YwqJK toxin-antitoxin module [Citrobacter farmeri]|uniref:toxin-antitoxin system YwqK family antitoxin n=1 Tax=Citrobacter farmeri TaxID=67824 RepID=UPI00209DFA39|nr:hypothetical protein [Citrobacter farmeri]MCP1691815.1 antitoxin component YwqK of YwqJK toxin-antitoxin module [Citrobacter farmeri]MCW2421917.1 antitoxin component YwqK of YwqJK toxin-antitoxin module [Citrobacter farmeri]
MLIREEHWREGQLHGECRCFYPSGQMQMREQWQDGLRHQQSEQFYPDGACAMRQQYVHGRLVHAPERWLPDGRAINARGQPQSRFSKWTEHL